jgi:SAM-dependent methyltransferase
MGTNHKRHPLYKHYQDYVIKNGKFIGKFEKMYQDYDDPWHQSEEINSTDKCLAIHLMKKYNVMRAVEIGCGLGNFTAKIKEAGIDVLGLDISPTAISYAKQKHPNCNFMTGDISDIDRYAEYNPDILIMAEITWYILEKLDNFLRLIKIKIPNILLLHLLTIYPEEKQKYGKNYFKSLPEIMEYFNMKYLEWGELHTINNDTIRTFFIGKWNS